MLALWPEVRRVAGESLIFEGTKGCRRRSQHLQSRQLSVTLNLASSLPVGFWRFSLPGRVRRCWPVKWCRSRRDAGADGALGIRAQSEAFRRTGAVCGGLDEEHSTLPRQRRKERTPCASG